MSNSPAVSPVTTETTIRKRTIPASEVAKDSASTAMPDFWEYVESLAPSQWIDHVIYLYREDPKSSNYSTEPAYVDKFAGMIEVRPGVTIPMDDRGMIEHAIREKHGGKAFRLICKKGKERITVGKCVNDAPPKYAEPNGTSINHPIHNSTVTDASVASKAIDAMAAQQPDAMRLAMEVLKSASDIVMRSANPPTTAAPVAPAASSLLDEELKRAMINRFVNPPDPPDPFAMFLKFKEVMQPAASNGVKDTLELIGTLKNSGLVAFGSAGKTSLLDLGREILPVVVTTAKEVMHEWRLGVEAQVRGVELSRGMNPQPPAPVAAVPPAIAPAPAAVPPPPGVPPAKETAPSGEPPFDWLAIKIVEILKEPSYTIDEAVDETLSFLYRSHAPVVALLLDPPKLDTRLSPGEQGLLQLFQHHPVLKHVPVNPRLVEYIKKFIMEATAAELERTAGATTPKPAPPAMPA